MRFEKETENKIREAFRQEDFQNFMFEAVFGESKDEYDELYRNVYKWELKVVEDRLVYLVKSHVHHNVSINRNAIVTFIIENIAENFGFMTCHENYTIFETKREYINVITIKERIKVHI